MRCVGVIPARGGSTGILRKNLVELAGRPLLAYTCEAALRSRRLDGVIVSTDDDEIAEVAEAYGVAAPFRRPRELAGPSTPMLPVVLHALDWLRAERGSESEIVALLQPTSPLRTEGHIDEALDLLEQSGGDAVVSVVEVPHAFTPASLLSRDERGLVSPLSAQDSFLRQEKPRLYARNGPAVYAAYVDSLRARGDLYGGATIGYEMSPLHSVDVDDADDLTLCEGLLRARSPG